jgi:NDP-sugar pyrophosphorylase family protein
MDWIDWGMTIFSAQIIRDCSDSDPFDLSSLTKRLAAAGRLAGFAVTDRFYEIGNPAGLAETAAYLSGLKDRPDEK